MDDDIDVLGLQTTQRLKKSSKEKENQISTQTKQMKLSSQGEHRKKKLSGIN